MRVLWLGMDDENGCVLHFRDLREELERLGVKLVGPGYTWAYGEKPAPLISDILVRAGPVDWVVYDDCNARGHIAINWDVRPDLLAIREHDWWPGHAKTLRERLKPDLIMGCYLRPDLPTNFVHVPQAVNTSRFYANGRSRDYAVGFYGATGKCYPKRGEARQIIAARDDSWIGKHTGYWHDGDTRSDGKTSFYNGDLARALRDVKCLWVDAPEQYQNCVLKFFEGAASGCLLIGTKPYGWESYFPRGSMVTCEPDQLDDAIDLYANSEPSRRSIAIQAMAHCRAKHSIQRRAAEIMEVLECRM